MLGQQSRAEEHAGTDLASAGIVCLHDEDGVLTGVQAQVQACGEVSPTQRVSDPAARLQPEPDPPVDRHAVPREITFRDGPTGRRAGLVNGPDVWEVALWLQDLRAEPDPVAALVEESSLTPAQIDAVVRYQSDYPDEIAARIELHRRETAGADSR